MDVACLLNSCLFSPVPSPPRLSRFPASRVQGRRRASRSSFVARRRQKPCITCGADTLVAGSEGSSQALPSDKIRAQGADLKSWLHLHGLPPCKVDLKERPSHDGKHHPIHYVVSSEDLQVGETSYDVFFITLPSFIDLIFDSWAGGRCCIFGAELISCDPG